MTAAPSLGSILLASTNPERLRQWYLDAFHPESDEGGFLTFGGVGILIDHRDDIAPRTSEPGRVILNLHVDDAVQSATHLDDLGVTWLCRIEERDDGKFAAFLDPDGNIIQLIEFNQAYLRRREHID